MLLKSLLNQHGSEICVWFVSVRCLWGWVSFLEMGRLLVSKCHIINIHSCNVNGREDQKVQITHLQRLYLTWLINCLCCKWLNHVSWLNHSITWSVSANRSSFGEKVNKNWTNLTKGINLPRRCCGEVWEKAEWVYYSEAVLSQINRLV